MNYIEIYKGKTISSANLINGVDMDSFSLTTNLDETFDVGTFNIVSNTNNAKQLTSRDYITIVEYEENPINDNGYTIVHQEQYIVDVVGETVIRKVGNSLLYEYQVSFYEKTAELQNVLTPNLASTQPLPDLWEYGEDGQIVNVQLVNAQTKHLQFSYGAFDGHSWSRYMYWTEFTGPAVAKAEEVPVYYIADSIEHKLIWNVPDVFWVVEMSQPRVYTHDYYARLLGPNGLIKQGMRSTFGDEYVFENVSGSTEYTFEVYGTDYNLYNNSTIKDKVFFTKWKFTIRDSDVNERDIASKYHTTYEVIDKVVKTIKPYKNIANTKYKIGDTCNYLMGKVCPDLFLTGNDMFTNLLLIGRTCNSIPYLDDNDYIQMLDLGKHDDAPSGLLDTYNGYTRITNYDGKVGACISDLQNMIPSNTLGNGTCEDSWRTLEVENGQQFTPDACYYKSDFPMYSLKAMYVKIWSTNGSYRGIYDMSKYMYESCVYTTLDTTDEGLNTIINALCWEQYGNKITGFQQKVATHYGTSDANAIASILHQLCPAESISDLLESWNTRTMFKAVYVPVINARVKQYRPDAMTINGDEIIINQQTNLGSLETTGDSMKNSLLMLGNDTISQKKFVSSWSDVPEINQQVSINNEKWIITQVVRAFSNKGYDLGITYSKNFNRLSANQSLATEKRWADVPLNSAINRTINLDDYLILSTSRTGIPTTNETDVFYIDKRGVGEQTTMLKYMFGAWGTDRKRFKDFKMFLSSFVDNGSGTELYETYPNKKTCETFIPSQNPLDNYWIHLPVVAGAFGNSIFLKASTKDNYSAKVGIISSNGYKFCQDVPYSSELGEGQYLNFMFSRDEVNTTSDDGWNIDIIESTSDKLIWYFNPQSNLNSSIWGNIADRVYVEKDSREQLDIVYQMHFVCKDEVFIGRAFSELNPMICDLNENRVEYVGVVLKGDYSATNSSIDVNDVLYTFTPQYDFTTDETTSNDRVYGSIPVGTNITGATTIAIAIKYNITSVGYGIVPKYEIIVGKPFSSTETLGNVTICYATLRSDLPKM